MWVSKCRIVFGGQILPLVGQTTCMFGRLGQITSNCRSLFSHRNTIDKCRKRINKIIRQRYDIKNINNDGKGFRSSPHKILEDILAIEKLNNNDSFQHLNSNLVMKLTVYYTKLKNCLTMHWSFGFVNSTDIRRWFP